VEWIGQATGPGRARPEILPVLALRVPAVRALAVRACAVRLRAGRVMCLRSARLDRADSARQRRRHRGGAPARALCWCCAYLRCAC
jgi:hypothetical protein